MGGAVSILGTGDSVTVDCRRIEARGEGLS
jgi:hypothetical protein